MEEECKNLKQKYESLFLILISIVLYVIIASILLYKQIDQKNYLRVTNLENSKQYNECIEELSDLKNSIKQEDNKLFDILQNTQSVLVKPEKVNP